MTRRAAITGLGVVSPLGLDYETSFDALLAGRSGVESISLFDASAHTTQIAAEVKGFDPASVLDRKLARKLARATTAPRWARGMPPLGPHFHAHLFPYCLRQQPTTSLPCTPYLRVLRNRPVTTDDPAFSWAL